MIEWQIKRFEELKTAELYEILRVRQEVFVVEQHCPYQDVDSLDNVSWHLYACDEKTDKILAYLRITDAGYKYPEISIGRVLTTEATRGMGLGKTLIKEAMAFLEKEAPKSPIRISAQLYLQKFYEAYGFNVVAEPYDEDDIPHIEMLKPF
jgi:ElaA protein